MHGAERSEEVRPQGRPHSGLERNPGETVAQHDLPVARQSSPSPAVMLRLQRAAGNHAVAALMAQRQVHQSSPAGLAVDGAAEEPEAQAEEAAGLEAAGLEASGAEVAQVGARPIAAGPVATVATTAEAAAGAPRAHWHERLTAGVTRTAQRARSRLGQAPSVQRCSKAEKAKAAADLPEKTVKVNVTYLKGGSTSLSSHLSKANQVYKQAKVRVTSGKEVTLDEAASKKILGDALILNEYDSPSAPTAEELELLKVNRAGGAITMYYVKALSQGSIGEAFMPSEGQVPGFVFASPVSRTFPHELGHVLLDDAGHPGDAKNFMAQTSTATGEELMTEDQIKTVRNSPYVG